MNFLCKFGFHKFGGKPIISELDTYWMQGGKQCIRCKVSRITFEEASNLINVAYDRGKLTSSTHFTAYGQGIKKVVDVYGKKYVQEILNSIEEKQITKEKEINERSLGLNK